MKLINNYQLFDKMNNNLIQNWFVQYYFIIQKKKNYFDNIRKQQWNNFDKHQQKKNN